MIKEYEKACKDGVYETPPENWSWRMRLLDTFAREGLYFNVYGRTRFQYECQNRLSECCHPGSTCLIGSRRLYMRADGVLLPCERVASNDTYFVIRDANNGIYLDKVKKKLDDFTQASDGECKNCWCFRMCNIGYLEGLVVNNKVESSKKSKDVWG